MTTPAAPGGRGTRARRAARQAPEPASPASGGGAPGSLPQGGAPGSLPKGGAPGHRDLDPDLLASLEEERDFLLRSLEDLDREHEAGDVDDVDYQALHEDYTARAAAAIHAIEDHRALARSVPRRAPGRTLAAVVAVVVLALGAGWLVMRSSGQRGAGDTTTGGVRESSIQLIDQAQQYTGQANAALQEGRGQDAVDLFKQALDSYDKALQIQPTNVEAMTYRGWLLHSLALQATGDTATELDAKASQWLDQAISTDATYPDARVFRAILLERQGRYADALADLDVVDPAKLPPQMTQMVTDLRTRLEGEAAAAP